MSKALSAEQQIIAETAVYRRIRKGPFTFQELVAAANRSLGFSAADQQTPCYRLADRLIQKQRRAGAISFARIGRQVVWSMTDKGNTAFPNA